MVFNTDFCGSNAGETFAVNGCPMVSWRFLSLLLSLLLSLSLSLWEVAKATRS